MKIIEVLRFNRELLERLIRIGIRLDDVKYIDMFYEYTTLKSRGEKVTYIVAALASRYSVSERKVYNLLHYFQSDCKFDAV